MHQLSDAFPGTSNSIFNLKVTLWWERPPGRDQTYRGQEAAPTEEIHPVSN